tara:strand:+ start:2032 stop:2649 length:618 start_codon:yes stop_codon:yes gene_type:complete
MSIDRFKLVTFIIAIFFVVLIVFIFKVPLLEKIGDNLVYRSKLVPSDAIVVLSGSPAGNRIEEAVRLFKKGMGKVMVFGGYPLYPGINSHEAMKKYAIRLGMPKEKIITEKLTGEISTRGEALFNLKQLELLKAKSFILVTSSFHTRRSHRIYEIEMKKLDMELILRVQPAHDPKVPIPGWWKVHSGKREILLEYIKSFYYLLAY